MSYVIPISAEFKKAALKTFAAVVFFLVAYTLVIIASLALAVGAVVGGVMLVLSIGHFFSLILAVGLVGFAVVVIIYIFKSFIISVPEERADRIEITAETEPVFFEYLKAIAKEVGVSRPGRVFLVPEVSAFVSFRSPFRSMFFPSSKDLYIGLALANALSRDELGAVIAHEFGHFSQRSLRGGSYVYHLNQVIFNMVYKEPVNFKWLEEVGQKTNILALCVYLTAGIIRLIGKIMEQLYKLVNVSYMTLSRQMEFHADAVSAVAFGPATIVSALKKTDYSEQVYNALVGEYQSMLSQRKRTVNYCHDHRAYLQLYASHVAFKYGIDDDPSGIAWLNWSARSRVTVKNQWASHPTLAEREQRVAGIRSDKIAGPALSDSLFQQLASYQEQFTTTMYESVSGYEELEKIDTATFRTLLESQLAESEFHPGYRGYYDIRSIKPFVIGGPMLPESRTDRQELLSEEKIRLPIMINQLEAEIELLNAIPAHKDIRRFDFDGEKYVSDQAAELALMLTTQLEQLQAALADNDFALYQAARFVAGASELSGLDEGYERIFFFLKQMETDAPAFNEVARIHSRFFVTLPLDEISNEVFVLNKREPAFKSAVRTLLSMDELADDQYQTAKEQFAAYLANESAYFDGRHYDNTTLTLLSEALATYQQVYGRLYFETCKRVFASQLECLQRTEAQLPISG